MTPERRPSAAALLLGVQGVTYEGPTHAEMNQAAAEMHAAIAKALDRYQKSQSHKAAALKKFCNDITSAGLSNPVYGAGSSLGGIRQKMIGTALEAALQRSRGRGRQVRPSQEISDMYEAWLALKQAGKATWDEVPAKGISEWLARHRGVSYTAGQIRGALKRARGRS